MNKEPTARLVKGASDNFSSNNHSLREESFNPPAYGTREASSGIPSPAGHDAEESGAGRDRGRGRG